MNIETEVNVSFKNKYLSSTYTSIYIYTKWPLMVMVESNGTTAHMCVTVIMINI